ncbi:MAG: hypothetical protein IJ456_10920 [Bacteroides sp.]|nr:hypothetical protein [Bacteroides sp.]
MEKRNYVKPVLNSEEFVPQVYCAACTHTESGVGMYQFVCDAGGGEYGDIITKSNQNLTSGEWSYYHACDASHEAPTTDDFISGYFVKNGGNDKLTYRENVGTFWNPQYVEKEYEKVEVIIWTGDGDVHATTNLNRDSWTKNIS